MNKISIAGNVTHDLTLTTSPYTDEPLVKFQVASNRPYRDHNGIRQTDFFTVKARNKLAEQCAAWLSRGSSVTVYGSIETYRDNDPSQRNVRFVVKAEHVTFHSPKRSGAEDSSLPPAEVADLPDEEVTA